MRQLWSLLLQDFKRYRNNSRTAKILSVCIEITLLITLLTCLNLILQILQMKFEISALIPVAISIVMLHIVEFVEASLREELFKRDLQYICTKSAENKQEKNAFWERYIPSKISKENR